MIKLGKVDCDTFINLKKSPELMKNSFNYLRSVEMNYFKGAPSNILITDSYDGINLKIEIFVYLARHF